MTIIINGDTGITSPGGDTASVSYSSPIVKSASSLTLQTNGSTTAVTIDTSQNVGIGQTSPGQKLDISTSGNIQLRVGNSVTGAQFTYDIGRVAASGLLQFYGNQTTATGYIFGGVDGERMRITTAGYVNINTIGQNLAQFEIKSTTNTFPQLMLTQANTGDGWLFNARADDGSLTYSRDQGGAISEKMRIALNGDVGIGITPSYRLHVATVAGNFVSGLTNSNASTPYGQTIIYSGSAPANTDYGFLYCSDTSNQKLVIYSSGTVSNRTGTYNALSDIKIKQDISDASSQWDDIKAVKFRKYRLIDDVKANPDAPYLLGVVAQELEETSPNLIDEAPDTVNKEDGTIEYLGTSTKQVKYSILYMKAVKALQEAMERIEAIEAKVDAQAAEITALKAAK